MVNQIHNQLQMELVHLFLTKLINAMKWMILLFVFSFNLCKGQYINNKEKNEYFYKLVQDQNKKKKIAHIFYNNNLNSLELWDTGRYNKSNKFISNRGNINFLSNKQDSLKILEYLHVNDTFFNGAKLMELVRKNKMIAYDYANPNKAYLLDSVLQILKLYTPICKEFEQKAIFDLYLIENPKDSPCNFENRYPLDDTKYFDVFLEIKKRCKKIKSIKTKGVIIYLPFNNPISGEYLGLAGLCCFVFK